MENQQLSPNIKAWQLGLGFANTSVIYTLMRSGVISQLRDSSKTLQQLSGDCKLNPEVLFRTLRFAIAIGVITLDNDQQKAVRWRGSGMAEKLAKSPAFPCYCRTFL